jgi:hypothetical protein
MRREEERRGEERRAEEYAGTTLPDHSRRASGNMSAMRD